MSVGTKHPHYHKDVSNLQTVDVYRVLALFNVTDPCIQHAVKKLLVAGGRGAEQSAFEAFYMDDFTDGATHYHELKSKPLPVLYIYPI